MTTKPLEPRSRKSPLSLGLLLGALVVAGLVLRVWVADLAIYHGYIPDHFDNICTGLTAERQGLLKIYSVSRDQLVTVHGTVYDQGRPQELSRPAATLPNHPPLYVLMRYGQVKLLRAITGGVEANTLAARLAMGLVPMLAELFCAVGVGLLAGRLAGRRAGLLAGAVAWFFPPILMNTAFWEQVDSLFLAPAVFAVLFMLRRQWCRAGACLALAALLKSQGLILAPVALCGAILVRQADGPAGVGPVFRRLGQMLAAFVAVVVLAGLPWMIADGPAWLMRCYVYSFLEAFPDTTLKAFNIWYLDALRLDSSLTFALDSRETIAGISKDSWGRVLLVAATAAAGWLVWKKYRRDDGGLVIFSCLWLWNVFMLPTRVHERYIIYCIPFALALAGWRKRYWPVVIGLLIVGTAEHSWNVWMTGPSAGSLMSRRVADAYYQQVQSAYDQQMASVAPDRRPPRPTYERVVEAYRRQAAARLPEYLRSRQDVEGWEYLLTILSLLSYAGIFAAAGKAGPPVREGGAGPPGKKRRPRS